MSENGGPVRCPWASNPLAIAYHDEEWGVSLHGDRALFEFLVLEGAQAGLSWDTILRKRPAYRVAFDGFAIERIAAYDDAKTAQLLTNPGVVRNRAKIAAAIGNARAALLVCEEFGSLDMFLWRFVDGAPVRNSWFAMGDVPAETPASRAMSKEMRRRGFGFVGPTICYAFMQATGMVNDHLVSCFRHAAIG